MTILEILFWASLAATAYAYLVYPIVLGFLSRCLGGNRIARDFPDSRESWPVVSLVITAYKDERVILERLESAFRLDYPSDRLEVIVGCDGNEDLTGALASSFGDSRVRLLEFPDCPGRAAVLNGCIPQANGSIVVLSDANTTMHGDALKRFVRHFADATVGGVYGELQLADPTTGCKVDGLYRRFEKFLQRCEIRLGAIQGASSAIYAIRKELYTPIPQGTQVDAFVIAESVQQAGYRLIHDEEAHAHQETPSSLESKDHQRNRNGAGALGTFGRLWPTLNPNRSWIGFAFRSHKMLRCLCPLFLLTALIANMNLASDSFYLRVLLLHELFYLAAVIALILMYGKTWSRALRRPRLIAWMHAALVGRFGKWLLKAKGGMRKQTSRRNGDREQLVVDHLREGEYVHEVVN
jgi:cellulose synthase/poly-beta-1,6-N-acetylglucosamine synthase-like glycosyltransferase